MTVSIPRLLAVLLAAAPLTAAAAPRVSVDIAPVHSIVARVMAGIGTPELIVPPGVSEHDYALRPSEATRLQEADLVVWIGPAHTPWLAEPIAALAPDAQVVTLADAAGTVLLPTRDDGPFGPADDHADHAEHAHGSVDGHMWLDPANATVFAAAAAAALAAADPANAAGYAANASAFATEMVALTEAIAARLEPVRGTPFIVFHDAFQYFEARFAMPAAGSVALAEGAPPSAARVAALRDRIAEAGVVCAFSEPQFEPKLLATILEGTDVRTAVLDPIGAGLAVGPELYPELLTTLADSLADCLDG